MLIKGQCREAPPLACFLRGLFQFEVFWVSGYRLGVRVVGRYFRDKQGRLCSCVLMSKNKFCHEYRRRGACGFAVHGLRNSANP